MRRTELPARHGQAAGGEPWSCCQLAASRREPSSRLRQRRVQAVVRNNRRHIYIMNSSPIKAITPIIAFAEHGAKIVSTDYIEQMTEL